jgi:hypothetical protein
MVATTTLMDYERNKPTLDEDVDYVLAEARNLTGKDWQVCVTTHRDKRLFSKDRVFKTWELLVYVGGCLPWQSLMCAKDRDTVFAYLAGVVSGVRGQKQDHE